MGLNTAQLEAFVEVARLKSFSRAAKSLHITQSALSQRILNLESELETALFIRDPAGLKLTDEGQDLLRYCGTKEALEEELLGKLKGFGVSGKIRIGGLSSVMRSLVIPAIAEMVLNNKQIRVDLYSREQRELMPLLMSNQVDFILTSMPSEKDGMASHHLGYEQNVLVRARHGRFRKGIFLDHDSDDSTTFDFLNLQSKAPKEFERHYLDEVYAIVDGVALGMGEAVLPLHLVRLDRRIQVIEGLKSLRIPLYLQYFKLPFYSKLHESVVKILLKEIPNILAQV